jgi:hypothetical protein
MHTHSSFLEKAHFQSDAALCMMMMMILHQHRNREQNSQVAKILFFFLQTIMAGGWCTMMLAKWQTLQLPPRTMEL